MLLIYIKLFSYTVDPGFGVGRFERFVVRTSVMSPDNWFDQREWCYILSPLISIYEFYLTIGRDYLSFQFCQLTQATRNKMTTFPMKLLWEQGTAMLLFNPSINGWDELLGLRARYFGLHGSGVAVEICSQFAMQLNSSNPDWCCFGLWITSHHQKLQTSNLW